MRIKTVMTAGITAFALVTLAGCKTNSSSNTANSKDITPSIISNSTTAMHKKTFDKLVPKNEHITPAYITVSIPDHNTNFTLITFKNNRANTPVYYYDSSHDINPTLKEYGVFSKNNIYYGNLVSISKTDSSLWYEISSLPNFNIVVPNTQDNTFEIIFKLEIPAVSNIELKYQGQKIRPCYTENPDYRGFLIKKDTKYVVVLTPISGKNEQENFIIQYSQP